MIVEEATEIILAGVVMMGLMEAIHLDQEDEQAVFQQVNGSCIIL